MPGRTNPPCAPALFILMAATLTSSAPAQLRISPTQPSSELCKISGIVRDSLTNQPIERALADGQWDATLTDNEGRFELHLPCGGYTQLQVRRPGYSNAQGADAVPVQVEPDTPEITLKLTPLAIITGHVSISNGGDLGDLYFRAFKSDYRNGHLWWSFAGQAKTDTNGAFQMYGLDSPASYLLCSQQAQEHSGVAPIASVIVRISHHLLSIRNGHRRRRPLATRARTACRRRNLHHAPAVLPRFHCCERAPGPAARHRYPQLITARA